MRNAQEEGRDFTGIFSECATILRGEIDYIAEGRSANRCVDELPLTRCMSTKVHACMSHACRAPQVVAHAAPCMLSTAGSKTTATVVVRWLGPAGCCMTAMRAIFAGG